VSDSLLPQDYVIQNIYTYCKRTVYKTGQSAYNAECCICNEGKSSGRKRRLFYFTQKRYFYCFNCSQSWTEAQWLQKVTNYNFIDILRDCSQFTVEFKPEVTKKSIVSEETKEIHPLPIGCIDLENEEQINFYSSQKKVYSKLQHAIEYCNSRRLFTAVNRSRHLYVSFEDKKHTNRLVIPFYDKDNQLVCYQSRSLLSSQFPKYLTKEGEKCLFGEDKIDPTIPYIFIFEGPIDAMFVRNAVAMAGTDASTKQQQLLNNSIGYEKIFVYDNDKGNTSLTKKIKNKLKNKQKVFVWPEKFNRFKDINEVCCHLKLDEFSWKFIVENSFSETEGLVKYTLTQKLSG